HPVQARWPSLRRFPARPGPCGWSREPSGGRGERHVRRPQGGAMSGEPLTWQEANQRYLVAALAVLRDRLDRHAARAREEPDATPEGLEPALFQAREEAAAAMPAPPALDVLCERFGLSFFERDVLLLCAGVELDSGFAARCAA